MKDENYTQLCVIHGVIVGDENVVEFEKFILDEFGCRVKYECEVKTLPGQGGEGGRNDLFFYIHSEDIGKFAVPRLSAGIRWWEDVLLNGNGELYTEEFLAKYQPTW